VIIKVKAPGTVRYLLSATLLVSAAAIAYEILLMRVLTIVHWHHFAWMIISLALLGYGASGTAVALGRQWLGSRFEASFSVSALAFSVSMVACLVLGQRVPFNALEIVWNPLQFLNLTAIYLLFMLPFFFAASCIALAFSCRSSLIERIYFFDLLGAGIGALLIIGILFMLRPLQALILLAFFALAASVIMGLNSTARKPLIVVQMAWLLVLGLTFSATRIELQISEFKGLSQALQVVDSQVLDESSSPLGMLTVVDSPRIPFRHAPGLSLNTRFLPPEQLAVFTDGDGMSVITRYAGDLDALGYLADTTAALPYQLLDRPKVLILGAGAGSDVLLALQQGASHVDAVELNPQVIAMASERFADFAGPVFDNERVEIHIGEARGFVARSKERYDLVQIALLDSFGVSGSGVQALNENYLYTIEAIRSYLEHLEPGGLLTITRWLRVPPRDSLKLAATVIEALREQGVSRPETRIAMIRSWNTVTLLARNGVFTQAEISRLKAFAQSHYFDTAWYPSMPDSEANRFNQLDRPYLYQGITALLGDVAADFTDRYKFHIVPATDDRPYFFHFFKWRVLPEILALRKRGGASMVEWGYLVLLATLVQAVVLGSLFILLPLALSRRNRPAVQEMRMGGYFFLLGLAFLFIEMAFIQKFILFLSHPLYSVAVVLAGFLVFAGLGSAYSGRAARRSQITAYSPVLFAVSGITIIVVTYIFLLPVLFDQLIGLADGLKIAISLALIAPLAFCMGMPFPLGLRQVAETAPDFIPWAWGINGFASVISAALATLLAIQFGFTFVLLAALVLYGSSVLLFKP
jgi:spermidine synthase